MSTGEWVLTAVIVALVLALLAGDALTARGPQRSGQRSTGVPIIASGATEPPPAPKSTVKGMAFGEGAAPTTPPPPRRPQYALIVHPDDEDQVREMEADHTLIPNLILQTKLPVFRVEIQVLETVQPGQVMLVRLDDAPPAHGR
jgi:hypothetical protein